MCVNWIVWWDESLPHWPVNCPGCNRWPLCLVPCINLFSVDHRKSPSKSITSICHTQMARGHLGLTRFWFLFISKKMPDSAEILQSPIVPIVLSNKVVRTDKHNWLLQSLSIVWCFFGDQQTSKSHEVGSPLTCPALTQLVYLWPLSVLSPVIYDVLCSTQLNGDKSFPLNSWAMAQSNFSFYHIFLYQWL